jgi:exodeoxyribonuclease VII small subunit
MSKDTPDTTPISALPFEEAMRQLESIVAGLERGDVSLEASIALYEKGELLKKRCEELLAEAQMRIEKITLGADGKPSGKAALDN